MFFGDLATGCEGRVGVKKLKCWHTTDAEIKGKSREAPDKEKISRKQAEKAQSIHPAEG